MTSPITRKMKYIGLGYIEEKKWETCPKVRGTP
jgi:hypothetical protein